MGPAGDTLWVDEPGALAELCRRLADARRLALDTEANGFHAYRPRLCLVQVAWEENGRARVALADPLALEGQLDPLRERLQSERQEKIVHGADYDVRLLKRDGEIALKALFDTELGARLLGYERTGLSHLAEHISGVRLSKSGRRTDWARRPLSSAARRYAADDALVLFAIRDEIGVALHRAGREQWAEEEFRRLEEVEPDTSAPPDARAVVDSLPGCRALDPEARAVLLTLVEWRERVARSADRPPGFVLPNRVLVDLARRGPESMSALRATALARPLVGRYGAGILQAVSEGRSSPPLERSKSSEGRAARPDRPTAAAIGRLKQRRNARARAIGIDPGVLCAGEVLKTMVQDRPDDLEGLVRAGMRRWQAEVVGGDLLDELAD